MLHPGYSRALTSICALVICGGAAFAQPAEVKVELTGGPVLSSCAGFSDGSILQATGYTLLFSARSGSLQDGASLGFVVYSPDGSIVNLPLAVPQLLGGWGDGTYWDFTGGELKTIYDSLLPEQILTGGAALPGAGFQEPNFVSIMSIDFTTPSANGVICIDSAFVPPLGEWLFAPEGPPVFTGGSGDIAFGGASPTALCFEIITSQQSPPPTCSYPPTATGDYCDTIMVSGSQPGATLTGTSHNGAGVLSNLGGGTFSYVPAPLDSNQTVTVTLSFQEPGTDHCGAPIVVSYDCSIDITVTTNCVGCCDVAGDADHSGTVNIGDVTFIIARIFAGGPAPVCVNEADANGDNSLNIADVTYLIDLIFNAGPAPVCGTAGP